MQVHQIAKYYKPQMFHWETTDKDINLCRIYLIKIGMQKFIVIIKEKLLLFSAQDFTDKKSSLDEYAINLIRLH